MKDRSTMGPFVFMIEVVYWGLLCMILYRSVFFCGLENWTTKESKMILWMILLFSVTVSYFFLFRKRRTGWNLMVSVVLPYGIYTLLAYWVLVGRAFRMIGRGFMVLWIVYAILILARKIKNHRILFRVLKNRIHKCMTAAASLLAIAMLMIMLPLGFQNVFGTTIFAAEDIVNAENEPEEQTMELNMDTLLKLQDEEWKKLDQDERIAVLKCIVKIESYYLGIPHKLKIVVDDLDGDILGSYSEKYHTVYIDSQALKDCDAEEMLLIMCHEVYHCYQHRLIDLYNNSDENMKNLRIFERVTAYQNEFAAYISGNEDPEGYYWQRCESDARTYSESAVSNYYWTIDQYLDKS